MSKNIQEVFNLIREGNKNAFLELNINLRIFMNLNPKIGEITRIYNHYHINDYTREEINSQIILIIIENILASNKLDEMKNWTELKWYSKRITKNLIDEYFRKKTREGKIFESIDSYEFNDDGEMISKQFEGGVNVDVIDYELEYAKLFKEVSRLMSPKCRDLFELVIKGISSDEVLEVLNNLGYTVRDKKNLASTKEKCKKKLIKEVRVHNNYSEWEDIFKMS